jgi:hypothetical protein
MQGGGINIPDCVKSIEITSTTAGTAIDDYVGDNNSVRVIDAYIDGLDVAAPDGPGTIPKIC